MHPQSVLVSETENLKLVDFRFRYGGVGRQPPSLRLEVGRTEFQRFICKQHTSLKYLPYLFGGWSQRSILDFLFYILLTYRW